MKSIHSTKFRLVSNKKFGLSRSRKVYLKPKNASKNKSKIKNVSKSRPKSKSKKRSRKI